MFRTNTLFNLEKNILNLGTLIISLQAYTWLKNHKHAVGVLHLAAFHIARNVFYDLQRKSFNVLSRTGTFHHSSCCFAISIWKNVKSSEAAMKMIMSSAFSSGLLLFGISIIYGATGTLDFAELSQHLTKVLYRFLHLSYFCRFCI